MLNNKADCDANQSRCTQSWGPVTLKMNPGLAMLLLQNSGLRWWGLQPPDSGFEQSSFNFTLEQSPVQLQRAMQTCPQVLAGVGTQSLTRHCPSGRP